MNLKTPSWYERHVSAFLCALLLMTVNTFALENPSFENEDPLYGWHCVVIKGGQEPSILSDCNDRKEGKQSLLITSKDPADIAIVQKINLPPDSLWRVSYWVKTEDLNAADSTVIGGALHVRAMDNLPVVETPSNFGTSPWKKTDVLFRVPVSGEVQLVLFFVGFGKGTGKAWFDDIRLEKIADAPAHVPITGSKSMKTSQLDEVMLKYREKIGCTAATLAMSKNGRMLYRRGYGWRDREKTMPADPDTMIGIASCGKPITAAGIRRLSRQKRFGLDEKLFDVLPIQPQGSIIDERVKNITINHLLENTAGWGYDPCGPATEMARKAGFKDPIPIEILLGFLMTRPLEDEPGSTAKYCNFGWDTLLHIIEQLTEKIYSEYVCTKLLGMAKLRGMHSPGRPFQEDGPALIWNDADGGPVSASARTLCRFMERFWLTGEPRREGNPYWVMYGSLDGSTAMMVWRSDGINLVALFNGRSSNVGHDEIKNDLEKIIDQIK
ncbi:MAG: serine hydrolase [Planctomycetota bacterium]|jgi:CubicO group peptidase (beta-lactamase class C family)